jgi:methylase of polypeptide subunit release factors
MESLTFKNGTHIKWNPGDDGGGSSHYPDFLNAIGNDKKYKKGLEWCSGLSAVAFSLIDSKICENFVLMDIYEPALTKAKQNAEDNNIGDNITYYVCDSIHKLPKTEKFDLVVANPPHCIDGDWIVESPNSETIHRLTIDLNWNLHKEFYENIVDYFNPGADLYISQICRHTIIDEYIKNSGLVLIEEFPAKYLSIDSKTNAFIAHFRYET